MTIHLTLQSLWAVGKYVLVFGAGFTSALVVAGIATSRAIGSVMW
jgi:hypothetical protein